MMHRNMSNRSLIVRSRTDGVLPLECIQMYVDQCLLKNIVSYYEECTQNDDPANEGDNTSEDAAVILQQVQIRLEKTGEEVERLGQSNGKTIPNDHNQANEKSNFEAKQQSETSKYVPLAQQSVTLCQNAQIVLQHFIHCSLLVGMHPDQATEFIIDLALAFNKPFAIIPCCVHSKLFPHRKCKKSGKLIRSYEDFLNYLQEKDSSICRATLDFDGRNVVLYRFTT
eukprot:7623402-Ditylum_brightwellii.AAC.1